MATKAYNTVVGVFADHENARNATRALRDAGFTEDQIGVASSNRSASASGVEADDDDGSYAGEGAMAGAATGAGIGALWGLGILAGILPAIGPAIAGGSLAVLLSSAAAGAAAAGLAGALIGMGLSTEEAEYYEGEMKSGRTIVTVNADGRRDEAMRIMRQFGGYDMTSRESHSHSETMTSTSTAARDAGVTTRGSTTSGMGHSTTRSTSTAADRDTANTIQAREERLHVEKTPVEKGEVKVRKEVHTEHKTLDVPVSREEVVIERRAGHGQAASSSDMSAGQEIRIPVREEQINVEKEAVVAEEVSVGKRRVQDTKHVGETLRKEEIKVENEGNAKIRDKRS